MNHVRERHLASRSRNVAWTHSEQPRFPVISLIRFRSRIGCEKFMARKYLFSR